MEIIMKRFISLATAMVIIFSAVFMGGCTDTKNKNFETKATEAKAQTQKFTSKELKSYLLSFTKGNNPLYGTWKIDGVNVVSYIFRNDGYGQMVMGSEADFTKLVIDKDKKTLSAAFVLGFNGTYNYKLSNNNETLTLTSDSEKFVLKKQPDFNLIPKAKKNPKIDKNILGWWKTDGKLIFFFGSDGIMYSNNITMETCYTYNAENGMIKAVYDYAGDVRVEHKYSYKNGVLTVDGNKYERFTP